MDIELTRTFLAIVETGSFRKAAERLSVTVSVVRAQMAEMERLLDKQMFKGSEPELKLTAAGQHFLPHARSLMRTWTRAKLDVALPEDIEVALEIGTTSYLWEHLLLPSFFRIRKELPKVAIKTIVGYSASYLSTILNPDLAGIMRFVLIAIISLLNNLLLHKSQHISL